jgi:hypothetical protein
MKGRMNHIQPRGDANPANEQARLEIHRFFQALGSYPNRFTKEPDLSFEQYLCSVLTAAQPSGRRRD